MASSAFSRRASRAAVLALAVCVAGAARPHAQAVRINGAGATFPLPLYSKWFWEYNKLHPEVEINYQAIGSGGGIRQVQQRTVFFGATDTPMTIAQMQAAPGPIVHVPTTLGAVVIIYNVPGVSSGLQFNGDVLAGIYLGAITRWNDPAIAALNPALLLPPLDITVVHRADGSGTTYIWADYLSKVSTPWKARVGVGTSLNWPAGIGGRGTEGVAGLVSQVPGSVGYVELIYALQNRMTVGAVQNMAGEFVRASVASVRAAAAASDLHLPPDFRVSITNAPGRGAYPIASFSWLLLYEHPARQDEAKAMIDFLQWALTDGQKYCAELGYAPLPASVVEVETAALIRIATT